MMQGDILFRKLPFARAATTESLCNSAQGKEEENTMGRPLNKKFFGDGSGLLAVECYTERAGASTAGYIVRQRSNLIYEIADEAVTDVDVDNLVIGSLYEITTTGTTDWIAAGAGSTAVGTRFYAATAASDGTGEAREIVFGKLQEAAVSAAGQARLPVVPENAVTPVKATFTVNRTAGGDINNDATVITSGGYGYWADGTFNITATTGGGTPAPEAVITYTVANGSIVTANVTTIGSGYTASADAALAVAAGDVPAPDANPPTQYARILNARQVKCFPAVGGNTYAWPTVPPLGGFRGPFSEADPDTQV